MIRRFNNKQRENKYITVNYFKKSNYIQIELIRVSFLKRRVMNIISNIFKILQYNTYKKINAVRVLLLQNLKI